MTGEVDAGRARRACLRIAWSEGDDARIGGEKAAERAVPHSEAAVNGKLAENRLFLRLESIDMRRIWIVQFETKGGKLRIADDDLEILVVVIESVDLTAQMTV